MLEWWTKSPMTWKRSCRLKAVPSELMEKAPGSVLCWGGVCSTAEVRAGIECNLQLNFVYLCTTLVERANRANESNRRSREATGYLEEQEAEFWNRTF